MQPRRRASRSGLKSSATRPFGFLKSWVELGYSALWIPEILGRHPFAQASWLLASTHQLIVATGIANILSRPAYVTAAAQKTLAEQSDGRFLLGLGVSHGPAGEAARSGASTSEEVPSGSPLALMRGYLDSLARAPYLAPVPNKEMPIVLAALGPKLLGLAAERTRGAHTYLVPPEHTAGARRILGDGPWLAVEQKVLLQTDPSKAREVARSATAFYLALKNYQASLTRLGYEQSDLTDGGSDRLIDALVAWGDEKAIRNRIQEHFDAGATHVCIQPLQPDGSDLPDLRVIEALGGS